MAQSKEVTEALRLMELHRGRRVSEEELRKQAFALAAAVSRHTGDPGATAENIEAAVRMREDAEKTNSEASRTASHG